MKKLNRKKVAISLLLICVIILEILAFGLSRAKNMISIDVEIIDKNALIENEKSTLSAIDGGESRILYCFTTSLNR
ncbi:MAG: hypothetical protein ACLUD1_07395 [Clostridia bacterium]